MHITPNGVVLVVVGVVVGVFLVIAMLRRRFVTPMTADEVALAVVGVLVLVLLMIAAVEVVGVYGVGGALLVLFLGCFPFMWK